MNLKKKKILKTMAIKAASPSCGIFKDHLVTKAILNGTFKWQSKGKKNNQALAALRQKYANK